MVEFARVVGHLWLLEKLFGAFEAMLLEEAGGQSNALYFQMNDARVLLYKFN